MKIAVMSKNGEVRIGISGWRYAGWRGDFYPGNLVQKNELKFAAERFSSIEINGTFYSLQRPSSFEQWREETPEDFVFAVKGSRFITHIRRLREIEVPLANFFASGVLALREKLGPFLWQFPPNFKFDHDRLEQFFKLLPRDTDQALELARLHDEHLKNPPFLERIKKRRLRHAIEVRHADFLCKEFMQLIRKHKIAFVFADTAGKWPYAEDLTSDFVYIRLHGAEELYASGYTEEALQWWADRIRSWRSGSEPSDPEKITVSQNRRKTGRDVFVFFDNDAKVRAPYDALRLREILEE